MPEYFTYAEDVISMSIREILKRGAPPPSKRKYKYKKPILSVTLIRANQMALINLEPVGNDAALPSGLAAAPV